MAKKGGMNMAVLIAYFSRKGYNYVNGDIIELKEGNTQVAAKKLQKIVGGDLFEIAQKKEYSNDYRECVAEAKKDYLEGVRPELKQYLEDIDKYDTIYLGYPNYCGTMPVAVFAFLEKYRFEGKTILPFCTNEGSKMGKSERDIKAICPNAILKEGLPLHGADIQSCDAQLKEWVERTKS